MECVPLIRMTCLSVYRSARTLHPCSFFYNNLSSDSLYYPGAGNRESISEVRGQKHNLALQVKVKVKVKLLNGKGMKD